MKKIALLFGLLFAFPAFAADNAVIVTPGTGVTMKSKDIGAGVQAMQPILSDASGNSLLTTSGADAVSNTLTGIPVYSRQLFYNGTTWDRWQGAIKAASGAFASGSIASGAMVDLGAQADAAWASGSGSLIAIAKTIAGNTGAAIPAGTANIGNVGQISQYPTGAIPYTASATGTTGATTATLTGAASVTTYLCSLSIRSNATAAATGNATVTGTITATLNYTHWTAPLASGIGITEMIFNPCVPASATNTSIAVISPAPGSGGTVSVTATGYKL